MESLNEKKYAIKITKSDKSDEEIGNNEINILKKLKNHPYILNIEDSFILKKIIKNIYVW